MRYSILTNPAYIVRTLDNALGCRRAPGLTVPNCRLISCYRFPRLGDNDIFLDVSSISLTALLLRSAYVHASRSTQLHLLG